MRQGISMTFTLCRQRLSESTMHSTFVLVSVCLAFLVCATDASIMVSAAQYTSTNFIINIWRIPIRNYIIFLSAFYLS